MTDFQSRLDALPEYPHFCPCDDADLTAWQRMRADAALARLALAREWIAEASHHDGCNCLYYVASSEMWFVSDDKPCTCGRDALLAKLEGPK